MARITRRRATSRKNKGGQAGHRRDHAADSVRGAAAPLLPHYGTSSATISTSTSLRLLSASLPAPAASRSSSASKEGQAFSHPRRPVRHSCATRSIASPSTSRPNMLRGSITSRFGSPSWCASFFAEATSPAGRPCGQRSSTSSLISTKPWPGPSAGPWKQNLSPARSK